jgi:hypothetical protein
LPAVISVPNPPVSFGHRNESDAMPKKPRNAENDAVVARLRNCRRDTAICSGVNGLRCRSGACWTAASEPPLPRLTAGGVPAGDSALAPRLGAVASAVRRWRRHATLTMNAAHARTLTATTTRAMVAGLIYSSPS